MSDGIDQLTQRIERLENKARPWLDGSGILTPQNFLDSYGKFVRDHPIIQDNRCREVHELTIACFRQRHRAIIKSLSADERNDPEWEKLERHLDESRVADAELLLPFHKWCLERKDTLSGDRLIDLGAWVEINFPWQEYDRRRLNLNVIQHKLPERRSIDTVEDEDDDD